MVNNCRRALCSFLGGYTPERVVFTKNCTEALNIAVFGLLKRGDHVITTPLEHNSVLRPLYKLKAEGVDVTIIPLKNGTIAAEDVAAAVKANTRAAIISLCSNVTGAAPDIEKIKAALPEDVLLICDGAQACGHIKINMRKCGIDVLAAAGHKGLHGIQGSGALLFSERCDILPLTLGGTGSESLSLEQPRFYPDRLESGTLSFPAIASLFEGALYLKENFERDEEKVKSMCAYLHAELKKIKLIKLYSAPNAAGIVAFAHMQRQSEEVAQELSDKFGICVRGGLHCAPLMHKALGTSEDGLVRASLSAFNRTDECEQLVRAIRLMR